MTRHTELRREIARTAPFANDYPPCPHCEDDTDAEVRDAN